MADPNTLRRYAKDAKRIAAQYRHAHVSDPIGWPDILRDSGFLAWLHQDFASAQGRSTLRRYRAALMATATCELNWVPDDLLRLPTGQDKVDRAAPRSDVPPALSNGTRRLNLTRDDWGALEAELVNWHYYFRSPWGKHAAELLGLTLRTGVLPREWAHARMTWPRGHIVLVVSDGDADADGQSGARRLQLNVERLGSDTCKLIVDTVELAHSLSAVDWHRRVERVRWHIRGAARRLWADIAPLATLQAARDHFCADLLAADWPRDKIARAVGLRRQLTRAVCKRLAQINVGAAKPSVGVELVGHDRVEAPRHAFVQA